MKVLVITSSFPRFEGDGSAPFIKSISENIASFGHQVYVVAPYDHELKESFVSTVSVHRFKYIYPLKFHIMGHARSLEADIKLRPFTYLLILPYLVFSFINCFILAIKMKPDVIHIHWVLPNGPVGWLLSCLLKIPYIVSLHGSDIYVANKNSLFRKIAGIVFRRASAVTACSPNLAAHARRMGAGEKVILIPWGADPSIFLPTLRDSEYRILKGFPSDATIIMALGRMVYKKGFGQLLAIWPRIVAKHRNAFLIIGGDGPIKNELEKVIHDQKILRVSIPGRIPWDEVPLMLANSDLFVLPSIRDQHGNEDGLPTVLLEAMASGLPVISSSIGGVPLVVEDYHNGILVEPGDTEQLLHAIEYFLVNRNAIRDMGINSREDVVTKYNWHTVAQEFDGIFNSIIKNTINE